MITEDDSIPIPTGYSITLRQLSGGQWQGILTSPTMSMRTQVFKGEIAASLCFNHCLLELKTTQRIDDKHPLKDLFKDMMPSNPKQQLSESEIIKIRMLDAFDLIMLISEINDHGWAMGRNTLRLMPQGTAQLDPDAPRKRKD